MADKPGLVLDEQLSTGWQRTEYHGDLDRAKSYAHQGRLLMGAVRTMHGFNQANTDNGGEGGGYYSSVKRYPDGTVIVATVNDGHNTVQIYAPTPGQPARAPRRELPADEPMAEHHEGPPPPTVEVEPEPWELTHESHEEHADEEAKRRAEEFEDDFEPYLWIGARLKSFDDQQVGEQYNFIHLCVWEQVNGSARILSNRHHLVSGQDDSGAYPLGDPPLVQPARLPVPEDPRDGIGAFVDSGLVQLSRPVGVGSEDPPYDHGLKLYAPDDPNQEDGEYDEVVICDPRDELGLGLPGSMGGGRYAVKVMVTGPDCWHLGPAEVELKIIAGQGVHRVVDRTRFTIREFTTYYRAILPLGYYGDVYGGPNDPCSTCRLAAPDHGPNPHGPHWWQGGAEVFVPPRHFSRWQVSDFEQGESTLVRPSIAFTDERLLPEPGFVPGDWPSRAERCPMCVTTIEEYFAFSFPVIGNLEFTSPGCPVGQGYPAFHEWTLEDAMARAHYSINTLPVDTSSPASVFYAGPGGWGLPLAGRAYSPVSGASVPAPIQAGGTNQSIEIEVTGWYVWQKGGPGMCMTGVFFPDDQLEPGEAQAPGFWAGVSTWGNTGNALAPYKQVLVTDDFGHTLQKYAEWVSLAEFQSVRPDPANFDRRIRVTCTTAEMP